MEMSIEAIKSFIDKNFIPTVKMPENTFYSLAVFALRYSMGGKTINQECIIGDIISIARLNPVAERIATCLLRDWDDYIRDVFRLGYSTPSENWCRCIAWFRAIQDRGFYRFKLSNRKDRKVMETCVAFNWDGKWIAADKFMFNQTAVAYVPKEYIVKEERLNELPYEIDPAFTKSNEKKNKRSKRK